MNRLELKRFENEYLDVLNNVIRNIGLLQPITFSNTITTSIAEKILTKEIIPVTISYNNQIIGCAALINIDWENKNCEVKIGLFDKYWASLDLSIVKEILLKILDFCKNTLRLKRIYGLTSNNTSEKLSAIKDIFTLEGTSKLSGNLYYGYVF